MGLFLLQAADSVATADTLDLQKTTVELVEKLATTPADQLLAEFGDKAIAFGLKVLAALVMPLWYISNFNNYMTDLSGHIKKRKDLSG